MHRHRVTRQIDSLVVFEFLDQPIDNLLIPIVATQLGITIGRLHFENTFGNFQNAYVKRTTAQIVYRNGLFAFFVQTVSKRCCGRFVNDSKHFQACDGACVFGGTTLIIIKVSWHGDNGLSNRFSKISLGIRLKFAKNHRGNLLGHESFSLPVNLTFDNRRSVLTFNNFVWQVSDLVLNFGVFTPNETLGRKDCIGRIGYRLALGRLTNQSLTVFAESNNGRSRPVSLGISDYLRLATFHDCHT